jgi:hypothetical protein
MRSSCPAPTVRKRTSFEGGAGATVRYAQLVALRPTACRVELEAEGGVVIGEVVHHGGEPHGFARDRRRRQVGLDVDRLGDAHRLAREAHPAALVARHHDELLLADGVGKATANADFAFAAEVRLPQGGARETRANGDVDRNGAHAQIAVARASAVTDGA